jgi:hypothetical protein
MLGDTTTFLRGNRVPAAVVSLGARFAAQGRGCRAILIPAILTGLPCRALPMPSVVCRRRRSPLRGEKTGFVGPPWQTRCNNSCGPVPTSPCGRCDVARRGNVWSWRGVSAPITLSSLLRPSRSARVKGVGSTIDWRWWQERASFGLRKRSLRSILSLGAGEGRPPARQPRGTLLLPHPLWPDSPG